MIGEPKVSHVRNTGDFGGHKTLHTSSDMAFQHRPQTITTKDCEQLWKSAASVVDEARAVQVLAEILADPEGRVFASHLDSKDAGLCIEILDQVSQDLHPSPFTASENLVRASQDTTSNPQRSRVSSSL